MIPRMQYVHNLNCQDNHYATASLSFRRRHAQLQILATIDHILEHVVDSVLMNAGAFSDYLANFTPNAAEKTSGAWQRLIKRIGGEDPQQITIVNRRPVKVVFLAFAPIVFAQRGSYD